MSTNTESTYYSIEKNTYLDRIFVLIRNQATKIWEYLRIPKSLIILLSILMTGFSIFQIYRHRFLSGAWLVITSYFYNIASTFYLQQNQSFHNVIHNHLILFLQYSCLFFVLYSMNFPNTVTTQYRMSLYTLLITIILGNLFIWQCSMSNQSQRRVPPVCQLSYVQQGIQTVGIGTLVIIFAGVLAYLHRYQ